MEGWFPFERGEHVCLRIAEAAERTSRPDDESQGALPSDPAARLLQPELTQRKPSERQALPNAGVDAGRKSVTVTGEVSLDIPLYGKSDKRPFSLSPEHRPRFNVR
jgi:hypothetical protein